MEKQLTPTVKLEPSNKNKVKNKKPMPAGGKKLRRILLLLIILVASLGVGLSILVHFSII